MNIIAVLTIFVACSVMSVYGCSCGPFRPWNQQYCESDFVIRATVVNEQVTEDYSRYSITRTYNVDITDVYRSNEMYDSAEKSVVLRGMIGCTPGLVVGTTYVIAGDVNPQGDLGFAFCDPVYEDNKFVQQQLATSPSCATRDVSQGNDLKTLRDLFHALEDKNLDDFHFADQK